MIRLLLITSLCLCACPSKQQSKRKPKNEISATVDHCQTIGPQNQTSAMPMQNAHYRDGQIVITLKNVQLNMCGSTPKLSYSVSKKRITIVSHLKEALACSKRCNVEMRLNDITSNGPYRISLSHDGFPWLVDAFEEMSVKTRK